MAKTELYHCDICGEKADIKDRRITVAFDTEQTEGRSSKLYLSPVIIDMCYSCENKIIQQWPVRASGAQGHNSYRLLGQQ